MLKKFMAATAALGVAACATTYSVTPVADATQDVTYDHGAPVVMSRMQNGAVRVAPTSTAFQGRMSLGVVAFNDSKASANLGTENVSVYTASGVPVRVFTYEQLAKEAQTAARWQAFAVALAGAANAYAASQPTTVTSYGTAYGPRGLISYSSSATAYNPANAALANSVNAAQTSRSMGQIGATLDATLRNLGSSILRTTTIEPGNAFGGNVIIDKPKFSKGEAQALRVVVNFDGEVHEFRFSVGAP